MFAQTTSYVLLYNPPNKMQTVLIIALAISSLINCILLDKCRRYNAIIKATSMVIEFITSELEDLNNEINQIKKLYNEIND